MRESEGNTALICAWLLFRFVLFVGVLVVSGFMVHIGVDNQGADCEENLDSFLLVDGVAGFVGVSILMTSKIIYECCGNRCEDRCDRFCLQGCIRFVVLGFLFSWQILGSVRVYRINYSEDMICPTLMYNFTWYFLTILWGTLIGAVAIVFIVGIVLVVVWFCNKDG